MIARRATVGRLLASLTAIAAASLMLLGASSASAAWELDEFDGGVFQANGDPATQAGGHPWTGWTSFHLAGKPGGGTKFSGDLRDVVVKLPPGLVGNPQAVVGTCPVAATGSGDANGCPADSQVGLVQLDGIYHPVYKIRTPPGSAAAFRFSILRVNIFVLAKVRTGDDYGVTVTTLDAPTFLGTKTVKFTFWGIPADPKWDPIRNNCIDQATGEPRSLTGCPISLAEPRKPFLSLPTSCVGPVSTFLTVRSWEGEEDSALFESHDNSLPIPNPIGNDGCNALDFSPALEARPTTNVADSPSGLDVDLHIPQNEDPDGTAEAHLRNTTVTLPEGMTVNPASANGLGACSTAQFGLTTPVGTAPIHTTEGAAECPGSSKLGTVEVDTPVLDHPVFGAAYIAKPYDNPFGSLLAIYLALDDEETGIVVKLAGKVELDPATGRLTATFEENPQLPFEDFKLHFFGGAGGALRTPSTCGTYSTTSSLTPWSAPDSGPPATPSDTWAIEQGPGGSCASDPASLPNAPSFDAGTISPIAGAYSPLVVNMRREDGSQQFSSLRLTPPPGLVGKLAGVAACPDSLLAAAATKSGREEEASPSCPASSYVGSVVAGAGAGPAPYYASGRAYLGGPYRGAPLSLAIVTPATAGPFDLGTIVVRTALFVDSKTAQITAVSDPLPTILQGIPLDVRSVQVKLDRPSFSLNPTSCDPMSFDGQLTSTLSQVASLQSRFQLGECGQLGFKPKMTLRLKGGTGRNAHPALTATLEPRSGDANIASLSVALPHSEFLDQAHIGTVCTRGQFAAGQCPVASIYGTATVTTPLLDYPLIGNVYLRSSDNVLPDLVPDLRGPANQPIELESSGRTDSIHGGIRNSFEFIPDAPFTKLVVQLQGGKKGLLVNSVNICAKPHKAAVKFAAHNGLTLEANPPLKADCAKSTKKHKKAKLHHGRR